MPEQDMTKPDWIAVDWGTTRLRAYAMSAAGDVLDRTASDEGMGRLKPVEFEAALLRCVGHWLGDRPTSVVACGMVGARQGWREAPYAAVPTAPLPGGFTMAPTGDPRLRVQIVGGLSQARPADVMRGEETQIAGAIAAQPGFDGVICLPGTHTKWAHVTGGEVVSFLTVMSGEIFDLLSHQSVLRHSLTAEGWDETAFAAEVAETLSRPERLTARLFSIRASGLLHGTGAAEARATLSGLLIGAELAAARPYWLGRDVALIGAPALAATYGRALALQGVAARILDAEAMTLSGLAAAQRLIAGAEA
jgi:2-dehydro-3-deoxygalactonokinase